MMSRRVAAILLSVALLISCAGQAKDSARLSILPLGDSITQGEVHMASYRYPLWKKLVDANVPFDFVGSIQKRQDKYTDQEEVLPPSYRGFVFDSDHEGHFAWAAEEIIQGRVVDDGSGRGKLKNWVKKYPVDLVLMHLGTNDAFHRDDVQSTVQELEDIVKILRRKNPNVVILMAKLIPASRKPGDDLAVEALNAEIPGLVTRLNSESSPVILVDHYTGFDAEKDTYDGVHPNQSGEEKMAETWFQAIMAVIP